MPRSGSGRAVRVACVGALFIAVAVYTLCARWIPFYDKAEPREALVVRAIVAGHGLALPRPGGRGIPSKPPFFHWLAALALESGVTPDELAIRLPSILLGAGGVAMVAVIGSRWYGLAGGILAGAVLGSSFEWLRAAVQARVDMTLTFFLTAVTLMWYQAVFASGGRALVRGGYLLAAAAVLTKGPVGIVLPLLVTVGAALMAGEPRRLRRLVDVAGGLLLIVPCAGWFALAWTGGGDAFIARQLIHENIQRFLGPASGGSHAKPFYYYLVALLGASFPWTLALPGALGRAWRRRRAEDGFLLTWIVVVIAFYSLAAGKRSAYLLALFPPLAMLIGRYLVDSFSAGPSTTVRGVLAAMAGIVAVPVLVLAFGMEASGLGLVVPYLRGGDLARAGAVLAIAVAYRWEVVATLVAIVVALSLLAVHGDGGRNGEGNLGRAVAVLCGLAVVWCGALAAFGTYPMARVLELRPFAEVVRGVVGPEDILWVREPVQNSFRYYVGRELRPWRDRRGDSASREFAVGEVPEDDAVLKRNRLVPRQVDLRKYARRVLALYEVRSAEDMRGISVWRDDVQARAATP